MSATLWNAATSNGFSTTLDGSVTDSDSSITLTTTTGLQAPGVLVIDRQDSDQVDTPSVREYITYTGISLNTLTGCSRGVAGSSAQGHSSGAIVEEVMSITHWNDLVEYLGVSHNSAGNILTSAATIANLDITERLDVSGASIIGAFPIHPTFVVPVSLTTATPGYKLVSPQDGAFTFISVIANSPISTTTLVLDFNKNGSTIFTDQNTRPVLVPGSSFFSTASIGEQAILAGETMEINIDDGGSQAGFSLIGRIA